MASFSERYGYTKPSEVLIREQITPEIQNAICNCMDHFISSVENLGMYESQCPTELLKYIWTHYFNKRELHSQYAPSINTNYIEDSSVAWYKKINLIEFIINEGFNYLKTHLYGIDNRYINYFIIELNSEFKRLNFAYRIIDRNIVEVTSEEEINTIQEALQNKNDTIKMHIDDALKLCSPSKPDYRNSIKESISAVEVFCREKIGERTLGEALKKLESNNIIIPQTLRNAFIQLYAYTNQPDTGIRHALMNDEGTYTPKAEEALFMLVACCAFINYLTKKESDK